MSRRSVRKAEAETEEMRKGLNEIMRARQKAGKPVPPLSKRRKTLKPKGKVSGYLWEREEAKYMK